jgi:hypothetical protein
MSNLAEVIEIPSDEQTQVAVRQALTEREKAQALTVIDADTLGLAGEYDKALREADKKAEEYFKPIKKSFDDGKAIVLAKEKEVRGPIAEAREILRKKMSAYLTEQENKRREEEARLRREAEEAARKEQERLMKLAEKAEAKGNAEKAEELAEQAAEVYVAPVAVAKAEPVKTANATVGAARDIEVEVVDLKAFIVALVEQNSGAFDALFNVKAAPLKAWAKTNGIKKFAGLAIRETFNARTR